MTRLTIPRLAVFLALVACKADGEARPGPKRDDPLPPATADDAPSAEKDTVRTSPPPTVTEDARAIVARGVNAFTLALYQEAKRPGNFCLSPFSAAMALALVDLGARGDTKQALERTLGLHDGPADAHAALGAILAQSEGGGDPFEQYGEKIPPHELIVANSLWAAQSYALDEGYVAAAEKNYAAKVERIDVSKPAASAATINGWVSRKTRDKIKELVPEAVINQLTRLIVVNAVYLEAQWRDPFREAGTTPATFHAEDGSKPSVPTMHQVHHFGYTEDDSVQVVELPYWSGPDAALSMVIILPRARDGLPAVEEALTQARLDQWIQALPTGTEMIDLALPKWKTETTLTLDDPLRAIGLDVMFGPQADFSGIAPEEGLHVDTVLQKTYIRVDEKGTEAAAATALMMAGAGMPSEPRKVVADRPFLYLIRDAKTGLVLFIGRVANPET